VKLLTGIQDADTASLPLFAAHIAADHARLATATGDAAAAAAMSRRAQELYTSINATPYLTSGSASQPEANTPPTTQEQTAVVGSSSLGVAPPTPLPSIFSALTERERAVAALVVAGMSYAQIARELFITRSTVGYHLTRIYAKTATNSRHELSSLARRR
jgi:DNA-binding CsgD family transcriptional regulator